MRSAPPTGESWPPAHVGVVILGMTFVRIAQGRITDFWKQDNSLTVPAQLGVDPPSVSGSHGQKGASA